MSADPRAARPSSTRAPTSPVETGEFSWSKLLNQLRYDAWVLGNHDFDWGIEPVGAAKRITPELLGLNG